MHQAAQHPTASLRSMVGMSCLAAHAALLSRRAHAAAGLLTSGQLAPAVDFVVRHPEALISLLSLSLSATIGAPWRSCAGLTAAPHPASARRAKHTHARVALT